MITRRIRCYGIVQGVGFRPTVDRHAREAGIAGTVCNRGPYVEIWAQGTGEQVDKFLQLLRTQPPHRASVIKTDVREVEHAPAFEGFAIVASEHTKGEVFVSPDIAICDDCARELFDPNDRRYLHPFINCTNCGPRLTILDSLPYDRERTSMRDFAMCPTCAHEYHDPTCRRYDAQPVCCNECGPQAYLLDRPQRGADAIVEARRILASGGIVAIKGIGGFHLACDATSQQAVGLLRARKHRPGKPFAVMARSLEVARREVEVNDVAQALLDGHQKPILLLPRRTDGLVCEDVAPGNPKLGVMLPYAPLQLLLFDYPDGQRVPDCLVMTSANESGAPICRDDQDARRELASLCDAILSHDRLIRMRADDTVLDLFGSTPYMVRRSRGWAPLPTLVSTGAKASVLAVGGELKNAFCLNANDLYYLSPYVGDLSDVRTVAALEEGIARFQTLLEHEPAVIACDLHPQYNSSILAEQLAARQGLPLVRVQHHYAHVASCMAENDVPGPVIGVSFDGTGYGEDGTIWGGEVLLADYDGYRRLGHIAPFPLAGADAASREGWRGALALLRGLYGAGAAPELAAKLGLCSPQEAQFVLAMIERGINTVATTSAGRLFDAVSAVLGVRRASSYEGEAATHLQFAAERGDAKSEVFVPPVPLRTDPADPDGPFVLATDELFRHVVERRLAGDDANGLARAFHEGLASLVVAACRRAREQTGVGTVALTGGCYQNLLLLHVSARRLREAGFVVLTHSLVPPNDGGIALGQAVVAAHRARRQGAQAPAGNNDLAARGGSPWSRGHEAKASAAPKATAARAQEDALARGASNREEPTCV